MNDSKMIALRADGFGTGKHIEYGTATPCGGRFALTNRHVVEADGERASNIECWFPDPRVGVAGCKGAPIKAKGAPIKATILAIHKELDIAILEMKLPEHSEALPYPLLADAFIRASSTVWKVVGFPIGATQGTHVGAGPECVRNCLELEAKPRSAQASQGGIEVVFDFPNPSAAKIGDLGSAGSREPEDGLGGGSGGAIYAYSSNSNAREGLIGIFAAATYRKKRTRHESQGTTIGKSKVHWRKATCGFMVPISAIRTWDAFVAIDPWKKQADREKSKLALLDHVLQCKPFYDIVKAQYSTLSPGRTNSVPNGTVLAEGLLELDLAESLALMERSANDILDKDWAKKTADYQGCGRSLRWMFRILVSHSLLTKEKERLRAQYVRTREGREILSLATKYLDLVAATVAAMNERHIEEFIVRLNRSGRFAPSFHEIIDVREAMFPAPNAGLNPIRNRQSLGEELIHRFGGIAEGDIDPHHPQDSIARLVTILDVLGIGRTQKMCLPALLVDGTISGDDARGLKDLQGMGFIAVVMEPPNPDSKPHPSEKVKRTSIYKVIADTMPSNAT